MAVVGGIGRLHDWVVGGVSDWCLGEDFDESVKCCQVDIPASMVPMEALQLASCFFGILLGVRPKLVEQPLLHDVVVDHDIGCRRDYVLDGPLEICAIRIGGALRFPWGNLLWTSPCILRIYPLFSFWLHQLVSAVSVFPLLYPQVIREKLVVQGMLLEAVELFFPVFLPSLRSSSSM